MWIYHDLSSSKQGLEDEFPLNMGKYHGLCELGEFFLVSMQILGPRIPYSHLD